jgi:molybdopterin-binding protein
MAEGTKRRLKFFRLFKVFKPISTVIIKNKYNPLQLRVVKTMKISARNQIPGTVKMIKKGPVSSEVVISTAGGNEIVSSITTGSVEKMNIHAGSKVYAIVKASEVMVGID